MRKQIFVVAVLVSAGGCYGGAVDDEVSLTESALNGEIIPSGGPLTRLTFANTSESLRRTNTLNYYDSVKTGIDGNGASITASIPTLTAFRNLYGFGTGEQITRYYNRGDLGIGREMHCVDKMVTNGQIACYVRNFAAGDSNTEFQFGLSANIAYANQNANAAFATVAMVFRDRSPIGGRNRVFFVVYDAAGRLANNAALDRHGITLANAFNSGNTDPAFGTPGVSTNNHIPSNCVACHGGQKYDATNFSQTGALFLPFDLDQFDYDDVAGKRRADQLTAFKRQNEMVRKVAALSFSTAGTSTTKQLDLWYRNTSLQGDRTEVFENSFDSAVVPTGWNGSSAARSVYLSVIRPSCRGCHMGNAFNRTFDTEAQFLTLAVQSAADICNFQMPHSLQSIRDFWLSPKPAALEAYFRTVNTSATNSAANLLRDCGPKSKVTLDPPQIRSGLAGLF